MSDNDLNKIKAEKKEYECVDAVYMKQAMEREEALLSQINELEQGIDKNKNNK